MSNLHKPDYWSDAKVHLSDVCPTMATIIQTYQGDEGLTSRGDAYGTLIRAIVGQQISVKAADSVHAKLVNAANNIAPENVQKLSVESLRDCGLSGQKVKYIQALTEQTLNGHLDDKHWQQDDETVIKHLTQLPGIGVWTAEMFLIFYLLRPDVFPVADLGVLNAINKHYNNGEKLEKAAYPKIATPWQPYRTVASWYLWRSLDPVPVKY